MSYTRTEMSPTVPAKPRRNRLLAVGIMGSTLAGIIIAALRPVWLTVPLQTAVESAGVAAPVVFVLLCALAAPLHLNSVLVALSSLLWPLPVAGVLSFTGSILGCVLTATLLARVGGIALQQRGNWPAWLDRLALQVARRPVVIGLMARVAGGSGVALEAFYLLAGYTRRQYLIITTIGIAIWVTQALVGVTVLHMAMQFSGWLAIVFVVAPILLVAVPLALRRKRKS